MTDSKFCEHGVNVGLENPPVFCGQCPPDTIESLRAQLAEVTRERDEARADDAKLGAAVRAVLDMFMWDHSTVRAEVESDRLAETVEGCIFVAIERAIRPADFVPAHAKASGGES